MTLTKEEFISNYNEMQRVDRNGRDTLVHVRPTEEPSSYKQMEARTDRIPAHPVAKNMKPLGYAMSKIELMDALSRDELVTIISLIDMQNLYSEIYRSEGWHLNLCKRDLMDLLSKDELMRLVTKSELRELYTKVSKEKHDRYNSKKELMDAYDKLKGRVNADKQLKDNGFVVACPYCRNHDLSKIQLVEVAREFFNIDKVEGGFIHSGRMRGATMLGEQSLECGKCGLEFAFPPRLALRPDPNKP